MRKTLKITAAVVIVLISVSAAALAYLVYPGQPSRSKAMVFEKFIELPRPRLLNVLDYLTIEGRTLFITDESSGSLFKVNLDSNAQGAVEIVSGMPGGGSVHGIALVPGRNVAFVTRSGENTVDIFDPGNLQQLGRIPVAEDPDAILYDPSNKVVYVANGDAKLATLIDPEKRATVGSILLPGKPEFAALDFGSGLLYQNLEDINAVAAIDLGKRAVAGQWPLAPCEGPSGMAIDSLQKRLFAVCKGNAKLVVFDLETHRVITSLEIGGGPDSVAFDHALHRIYCAGRAGQLTVIQQVDPNTYRVLDEIHTHYGAHTLAVEPVSHKVFVAYASLLARPRIAVFSPTP
jgi:DNA-binding beta-propeller fold protein YncE